MTAAATLVVAQEATQNPLLPAVYDIVWSLVIFLIIAGVLGWYAVPRLTKVLDERSERIEGGLRLAEEAKAEAADARERVEAEIAQARRESAAIRERAG
ncbi:F0F1 ATP synthase subunit B, partial [Georgenia sp. 10Sc9-8]|nr:F0F1 ATP synthase subunit B [Georgenia halotolerans]